MELNAGGITASYNARTKALLEPTSGKQKQVELIQILIHVEFVRPLTSLPTIFNNKNK